ncbi:hypothetical protein HN011_009246 [Eciton burchellii]|nr:hypothetical protein HN011_009246 [Eciton burchellii]
MIRTLTSLQSASWLPDAVTIASAWSNSGAWMQGYVIATTPLRYDSRFSSTDSSTGLDIDYSEIRFVQAVFMSLSNKYNQEGINGSSCRRRACAYAYAASPERARGVALHTRCSALLILLE